jgi:antitoxin ParD1/3/4
MNVHLTPELEQLVQSKVKTGRYNSASEVVREALRLLEEHDQIRQMRLQEIRRKIQEGWDSLQRGEGMDGEEVVAELDAELARRGQRPRRSRLSGQAYPSL